MDKWFDSSACVLTLQLALLTTAILLLVALPLAYWIAFGKSRIRFLLEAAIALPLVLPPTVLGFYLLVGLGPQTAVGRALTAMMGHTLAFSFAGLLAGSVLYSLPFAVQPIVAGLRGVDSRYMDAASTLGSSPLRTFLRVALPLARSSMLTAGVLTFAHTVGEFGVVLMLGGSIPGRTKTLSIALYDLVENGQFREANLLAVALLLFSTLALVVLYAWPARRRHSHG